jgi:hypothetical protein
VCFDIAKLRVIKDVDLKLLPINQLIENKNYLKSNNLVVEKQENLIIILNNFSFLMVIKKPFMRNLRHGKCEGSYP